MSDQKQTPEQVQAMIVNALACHLLAKEPQKMVVLTHQELQELIQQYTLRLEVVNPRQPETSDVRIQLVTVQDAEKMLQALTRKKR
jgi:hypothetical protein